jgi:hypothetical protein
MMDPQQPQQQPQSVNPAEEARKNLSRKRIYWALVVFDVLIGCVLVYEIIALFIK